MTLPPLATSPVGTVTTEFTARGLIFCASLHATLTVPPPASIRLEILICMPLTGKGNMIALRAANASFISALQTTFSCAMRSAAVLATAVALVLAVKASAISVTPKYIVIRRGEMIANSTAAKPSRAVANFLT